MGPVGEVGVGRSITYSLILVLLWLVLILVVVACIWYSIYGE